MVIGNDDVVVPGALTTIIDDIESTHSPLLLYAKRRINVDGSPRAAVPGSIPMELAEGDDSPFPNRSSMQRGVKD